jgi:hypothetical protein
MNLRLPPPLDYFNRENEAQTRALIEQALASLGTQGVTFFSELEAGTLDVTGAVALANTLNVTGAVTLDSTLDVGGRITSDVALRAGEASRPAEVTSTRVTADTAVWASVLPAGQSFVCAIFSVRDATNGGSALIYADVNGGATVVQSAPSTSTVVVSGTPGATQIGVRISGTDLQVLAGSSRDGALIDTTVLFSVL